MIGSALMRRNWHDYWAQRVADRTLNLVQLQLYCHLRGRTDLRFCDMVDIIREHVTQLLVVRFVDRPRYQREHYEMGGLYGYYIIRHQIFIPDLLEAAMYLIETGNAEVCAAFPVNGAEDYYSNYITIDITNENDE